jgi:pentatricopeptide repeat protein
MRRNQTNRAIALLHQMHPLPEHLLPNDIQHEERIEFNLENSVFAHNILLSEFAKQNCLPIAQWFLTRMREQHINVLPFSITSMLNAVAQSKKVTIAMLQVLFTEFTALCPKLDVFGYNTFTYHFMARGCKEEAYEVLARMREANIYPDECTFSILIHACVKQQDWQAAKTLIAQMRALKLTPSPDLYGVLLGGYARIRDIDGMRETLCEMNENNIAQSLVIWNCTLSMVARSNNLTGTLYVFNCIRKLGLSLDKYTFWWVFYAYRWTICRVQRDFNRTEFAPKSLESYNISDNELQLPFSLLAEMKELNITIDTKLAYLINFVLYRITQLRRLGSTHIDMNRIANQGSTQ